MIRLRHLLMILLTIISVVPLDARSSELKLGLRSGHNAAFGTFAAVSLQSRQSFNESILIDAGAQYNSIGRTALEARPAYFMEYSWGRISAELLLTYSGLGSVHNIATGAGADFSNRWIGVKLGYYYRIFGHSGNLIKEPFNIYYGLRFNLLPAADNWDILLHITNNESFELERHYQPSFIAECRHELSSKLGLSLGLGYKPAGMFNISAGYYQTFMNLGICYRW